MDATAPATATDPADDLDVDGAPPTAPSPPTPDTDDDDGAGAVAYAQAQLDAARARAFGRLQAPGAASAEVGAAIGRIRVAAASPAREEELARRNRELERRHRARLRITAAQLGVPEDDDLREVVLDDGVPETASMRAVRAALAWRGDARRGLVLVVAGERGAGKTAAIAHAVVRVEQSALFVGAPTVGATPRNGFSENAHAWDRWLSVAVLALDDAGTEQGDPEQIAALLCERYDHGRATLVSTNLSRKDFVARYLSGEIGKRLADRLINAQGRAVTAGERRVIGPGGTPWFVFVAGTSLRSTEARVALRAGAEGRR